MIKMSRLEKLQAIIHGSRKRPLGAKLSDHRLCLRIYADIASVRGGK